MVDSKTPEPATPSAFDARTLRRPDIKLLENLDNRETDALGYAVESLIWFLTTLNSTPRPAWADVIEKSFENAVTIVLAAFADDDSRSRFATERLHNLVASLASWRNDIADPAAHPLAELAKVLAGDPGPSLDYHGPVFQLTIDSVLEGIAYEHLDTVWGYDEEHARAVLFSLCAVSLGLLAETCFWASHGTGHHLINELRRAFSSTDTAQALRGQMATLLLSGQALAWGEEVEFIPERSAERITTPDLVVRRGSTALSIECTTSGRASRLPNQLNEIGASIAVGWNAKKGKFALPEYQPGLITIDVSGQPIDRGIGMFLRPELVERVKLTTKDGRVRTIGISRSRDDFELMLHESQTRRPIALAATALRSATARENNIKGLFVHYGQNIVVDTIEDAIRRPYRGVLYWSGETTDPEFELALKATQPPVSNNVPDNLLPQPYVHLV